MTAPLPVITTHMLERRERGYLAWVAVANEVAELPLESPPIDTSTHALEIHAEGFDEPLVVLADPVGGPTSGGFPLRLRPLDAVQENQLRYELFAGEGSKATATPALPSLARGPAQVAPSARQRSELPPAMSREHALVLASVNAPARRSTRPPGSLTGRVLGDGRFILDALLGGGGSGEVYRGTHATLRRQVAVKILHPSLQDNHDYCARFYGEALAASQLDHRNVLRILDYGQEPDGLLYIVMELLDGKSLQQVIDREGQLPLPRIVELVAQACAGLAHAHDHGVIHRDIKPENIVVVKALDDDRRETDVVKVCDFGIAHWSPQQPAHEIGDEDDTLIRRPDPSKVVGTPIYMAPEQIRNAPVDARTDVYALGIVLYELATGHVPFLSDDTTEILTAHLAHAPPRPSRYVADLSPGLEALILKALSKDPADRHRDMRELRADLRRLVSDDGLGPSGMFRKVSIRQTALTADDFARDPADALGTLHDLAERDRPAAYAAFAEALKATIAARDLALARTFVAWLEERLGDRALGESERTLAQRTLNVLRDPEVVRVHVADLLARRVPRTADALGIVRAAGPLAARAAIDLRRARSMSLEERAQLVSLLRAIGSPALPVITATLGSLVGLANRQEEALAEDLLRGIPDGRFDAAGDVTVRFIRLDRPSVGLTALRVTTTLWGPRAQPLLVGVLDAPDDAFRLLALEELVRLGCIDDLVVDRLGRLVGGLAGEEVKVAAAAALATARPEARSRAIAFLLGRLGSTQGVIGSLRSALAGRDEVPVVVALARALVRLEPDGSAGVLRRLAGQRPELRADLDAVLATLR